MKVGERSAYALLERSTGEGLAERGRAPGLLSAEAQMAERRDHFLGRGPGPIRCRLAPRFVRCPLRGRLPPSFRRTPRLLALVAHELGAKRALGLELVELNRYAVEPLHLSRVSLDVGA